MRYSGRMRRICEMPRTAIRIRVSIVCKTGGRGFSMLCLLHGARRRGTTSRRSKEVRHQTSSALWLTGSFRWLGGAASK